MFSNQIVMSISYRATLAMLLRTMCRTVFQMDVKQN